jgi:simple sugar transport system permease protein
MNFTETLVKAIPLMLTGIGVGLAFRLKFWNIGAEGQLLFGGINAVQFRLQASGTDIPASFLNMLPYLATIIALVVMTWIEKYNKKIGAPAALATSYMRGEK